MEKKIMTFEEGKKLLDDILKMLPSKTFVIAFRVGNDLISTLGGTKEEMLLMTEKFIDEIKKNAK